MVYNQAMSDLASSPDANEAQLCGLPQRASSRGRDPLEEAATDFLNQLRAGDAPDVEAFVQRYPKLEAELREFLPFVAAMEDWKSNQELQSLKHPLPEQFDLERLGEYRIIREIARGGMGVVFEAEQEPIARRVAVKLLPWKFSEASPWGQRFHHEARIAARLQHAHIVPVFSFGEQDERFYYVMQLIEGVGLDKLIDRWQTGDGSVDMDELVREFHPDLAPVHGIIADAEGPGTGNGCHGSVSREKRADREAGSPHAHGSQSRAPRRVIRKDAWLQLAKIAAQITGALRYAHKQGTLHRDIKPANLLIDVRGNVWITDFGLALGRDRALSGDSEPLMGTLRYMAPEQFDGEVDVRTDIYSLGATLFELLTLRPVFQGQSRRELIEQVQQAKIPRPRSLVREIPPRLEAILVKALQKDPNRRHQSADELHSELLHFLKTESRRRGRSFWKRFPW
jgi:eukaryotic-like serine/threonine-protein kinase